MRIMILAAVAALAGAVQAQAAPASVSVAIGPELQVEARKTYGTAEIQKLAASLEREVTRELARTGAHADSRIELVLADVKPNRPTFKQLGDRPGLSMQSFGIGGARIEGRVVAPDGTAEPVSYSWYESDIRNAQASWVWSDAEFTFDRFARKLSHGEALARR